MQDLQKQKLEWARTQTKERELAMTQKYQAADNIRAYKETAKQNHFLHLKLRELSGAETREQKREAVELVSQQK